MSAGGRSRSSLVFTGALLVAAFALLARRDDGAGLLVPRPGPPTAARGLTRPFGLALRLQRAALAGWAVGLFFGGLSIGLTAQDADSFLGDSEEVNELFAQAAGSLVDNYLAISLLSMALIGTGFAIAAVLKMRTEETAGRLEPLLATALARPRWAAGYVAVAALGTVVVLAASGLGAGIADAAESGDLGRVPLLVGSSVALAPAVWVLIGRRRRAVRTAAADWSRPPGGRWRRATSRRSSGRCSGCRTGSWTCRRSRTCRCCRRPIGHGAAGRADRCRGCVVRRRDGGLPAANVPA